MASRKAKPVLLSICAGAGGEMDDALRMMTSGSLTEENGGYTLRYEETLGDSPLPQNVKLSLREGVVSMTRSGEYGSDMVFQKGKRYESQYHTPYGTLDMAVFCTNVNYHVDKSGGDILLQYQLDLQGRFVAVHEMYLQFLVKSGGKSGYAPS